MNGFLPRTLIEAASFADPTFVGGATDIMPLIRNEVRDDENLILLKNIPELKELRDTPEHIVIGSGVRLAELARSELINTRCAAVAQAAAVTASPQIRNIATIGGNVMQDRRCIYFNQSEQWRGALPLCYKTGGEVCHQIPNSPVCRAIYYSDLATALIALDAEAEYLEQGELRRTSVQELVQRRSNQTLQYELVSASGPDHAKVFTSRVLLNGQPIGKGQGHSKKEAEQTAAHAGLTTLIRG